MSTITYQFLCLHPCSHGFTLKTLAWLKNEHYSISHFSRTCQLGIFTVNSNLAVTEHVLSYLYVNYEYQLVMQVLRMFNH